MGDRHLPMTVFQEIILQRYIFAIMNSKNSYDYKKLKSLSNYPNDENLIVPEVEYLEHLNAEKKLIGGGKKWQSYRPDFVIYPKLSESNLDIERKGSLFGIGSLLEVKMSLEHTFGIHQWIGLLHNGRSIVASLTVLKDGEWEEKCQRVVEEIVGREPTLEGAEWLQKPHERVQYFPITRSHLDEWYVKNAALMLDDQLHDKSKPRFWLCVLTNGSMKNWQRIQERFGKNKRFWAWKNDPRVLQSLLRVRDGDYLAFVHAQQVPHPNHPKTTRWSYNFKPGQRATEKQMHSMKVEIKRAYFVKATSSSTKQKNYSAYHVKLGDEEEATFFENCNSDDCSVPGCEGCPEYGKRPMNRIKWPHCLNFQELDSVICKEKTKIIRGSIGAKWTESGLEVRGNHPVELTYDEFTILKASIYANQTTETDEKRISKGEIEEIIQNLKEIINSSND
ncbi:MAG: hypothetical protein ACJZ6A_00080 [Candidatus Poseidoniaceae archaeon]